MSFESSKPRRQSIDEILAQLKNTPEPNSFERTVEGVPCKIFPTSANTWNVYVDSVLYTVTKGGDGNYIVDMQSNIDLTQEALRLGKTTAVLAVTSI